MDALHRHMQLYRCVSWQWSYRVEGCCCSKVCTESSPDKGECHYTGKTGGGDERFFRILCVPIQDFGWGLQLLSETPLGDDG